MLTTYDQVYAYYVDQAKWFSNLVDGLILKTDCFNEANNKRVATDKMVLIEYDSEMIANALANYPDLKIIQGDIREMSLDSNMFDGVMDLSTIDHVPEYWKVLKEYKRVLKDDGLLYLIAWTGPLQNEQEWSSTNQYFFDEKELESSLKELFMIESSQTIFREKQPNYHNGTLMEYICRS